ncbi:MAG TPA: ABC transporter permease [Chloroflexia bacterium]|nr:ABC transporter permease [Chloroflexia bacterium]
MLNAVTEGAGAAPRESAWTENWRTFKVAARLGWQVESNWADPLVFLSFAVVRPLAAALILVVMYTVIAGGQRGDFFTYLYLSNAFFVLVIETMSGLAWTILEDRENYKMLKYVYTSPARKFAYLIGRAVARICLGLLTASVLLTVGVLFLGLQIELGNVQWGWLALYFPLGMVILLGLGIVLAGVALVIARHGGSIGEVTAGSLLLFSGAYFPVDILPPVIREISMGVPVTYWLEGMRRAIHGGILTYPAPGAEAGTTERPISPMLASLDNWQLLAILAVSAGAAAVISVLFYQWVENQAKERGMIDRLTGY